MEQQLKYIAITRNNFSELMAGLTMEQLNQVPAGFNNNIAWNYCHIIVATQGLVLALSGINGPVPQEQAAKYKKGTKPESYISSDEIEYFKDASVKILQQIQEGIMQGIFTNYTSYTTTSFNATLNNVEDALTMVQSHDALHYGYALALRRAVLAVNE